MNGQHIIWEWAVVQFRRYLQPRNDELAPWLINYLYCEIDAGDNAVAFQITARPTLFIQFIIEGAHQIRTLGEDSVRDVPPVALFCPYNYRSDDMVISGKMRTLAARLQPSAAHLLFGFEMPDYVNSFVAPQRSERVIAELRTAPDPETMVKIANAWLLSLSLTAKPKDNVAFAADKIRAANGVIEIATLAHEAGCSDRHFQRIFTRQVGVAPKAYARLCRLDHAIYMHEQFPKMAWSEIAFSCGYADQSHLARDFRALQNETPTQFRRYLWLGEDGKALDTMSELFKPES